MLIDYNSTDGGADVVRREAPPTWRVVRSAAWSKSPSFRLDEAIAGHWQVVRLHRKAWDRPQHSGEAPHHLSSHKEAVASQPHAAQVATFAAFDHLGSTEAHFGAVPLDQQVMLIPLPHSPYGCFCPSLWVLMPLPPLDQQVMREEAKFPHDWHLALTTTEFVVHPDLRGALAALEPPLNDGGGDGGNGDGSGGNGGNGGNGGGSGGGRSGGGAWCVARFPAVQIIGSDATPLRRYADLVSQRSEYGLCARDARCSTTSNRWFSRFVHTPLLKTRDADLADRPG